MALFAVTLTDQTTDVVEGADAYQQEGPLTTFFSLPEDRHVIDSWSVRLASYRTADISAIRRSQVSTLAPPGGMGALPDEREMSVA
ncbi:MAG: hypothetical protein AAF531_08255 [Actinomycetota bacterium]